MKKIISVAIIILILAAVAVAIRSVTNEPAAVPTDSGRVRAPEEVILKVGEEKEAAGINVKLNNIISDSRCGTDTLCIQAGNVTVSATLSVDSTSTTTTMASAAAPIIFEGYEVSIPRVAPARFATSTFTPDQYDITFRVAPLAQEPTAKLNGNPTDFSSEGVITFINQGAGSGTPTLVYAQGNATSTATLVFDELSFCAAQNGSEQCVALNVPLNVPYDGKRVLVEGISQNTNEVLVRKLWTIAPGESVLPTTGNVYVTWEQARNFIESCGVEMVIQTHRLDVIMDMKGGGELRTVEPVIDEIFRTLDASKSVCGTIPVATE